MAEHAPVRLRRASATDGIALVLVALVVLVVFLDEPHVLPRTGAVLDLSWRMLPLYALYSLLRMACAYALSLAFAFGAGYWASASPLARRLVLPALDVLQSVPILGFFPAAVFFFVRLSGDSFLGVEAAAVFLIFTSQAWNLAFSVHESLTTIPDDLRTAVRMSGASGPVLWRRLLLPACVPGLVYNSMLSWAAGWYFLVASEIIAVGRRTWILPGLGSYVGEAVALGQYGEAAAGLSALLALIVALHLLVWSPLQFWARRFRHDDAVGTGTEAAPLARAILRRAPLVRGISLRAGRRLAQVLGRVTAAAFSALSHPWIRPVLALAGLLALAALGYGALQTAEVLVRPLPREALSIPGALGLSFLRLLVAYAVSLLWTVPLACWVSRSERRAARLMPVAQVLASLPATAFFPVVVAVVLRLRLDLNVSAVLLVLTGMQWYLLFNLVSAAQAMPGDLRELARATGGGPLFYLRRFFLPAALPSLVTGSVTAWGGGWNALVIAESVSVGGRTWSVTGVGTLLERATYAQGDLQMITLLIVTMVAAVLTLNRAVWRPLHAWSSERYRLDA